MNRRGFLAASAGVAVAGTAVVEGCNSSGISNIIGGGGNGGGAQGAYTLTVAHTNSTINGYRLLTRTYNGSTVGPTLDAYPGTILKVRIVNNLPPNPPASVPAGAVRVADAHDMGDLMRRKPLAYRTANTPLDPMNNPHLFNTTNLHVHGIQTVPHLFEPVGTTNPAAMMIAIDPGQTYDYAFPIPADQPPGLYWYHPHHHGSTDVQVAGGMAGLIVVHGAIDQDPEIAAARDIRVVVQSLNLNPSTTDPTLYEYEPVAYVAPPQGYNLGTDFSLYTVNGQGVCWADNNANNYTPLPLPSLQMAPGEVVRLRFLNGTNAMWLPLVLPGFEIHMIAFDGVNFQTPFSVAQNGTTLVTPANMGANTMVFVAPGNRMEMLIKAPAATGSYKLSALATNGVNFMPFPQIDLMNVVVSGAPVTMGIPTALPTPTREYPLITDGEIVNRRTITFSEGPADQLLTGFGFFIDNVLYEEMTVNYSAQIGTCEEWTIVNSGAEAHPFHLHENSFEVTHVNGTPVPIAIWDTFPIPPSTGGGNGSFTLRVRFKGAPGKTVFHCHILPHEDTGMMANLMMV